MTSKFEQLIEYVINDDEQKAKELFHNIVVEKSREIYENLMQEEEAVDEDMEDTSGDSSQDLMQEVETDESGMNEEDEESEFDDEDNSDEEDEESEFDDEDNSDDEESDSSFGDEGGNDTEHDIEDRVVDLEDKLDELMAEFEELMGDKDAGMDGDDVGGDAYTDDDTSEFDDEPGMGMMENLSLDKVSALKHGDNGENPRSTTAFNSGAAGMAAKPIRNTTTEPNPDGTAAYKAPTGYLDKGRGDLPGANKFKNVPGKGGVNSKLAPATKPHLSQATGVNTKTPFPRG
jgi:hypothetical protein